jgi:hypothetical protein
MKQTAISREQLGFAIARVEGAVKRISESVYKVKSQNDNDDYDVSSTEFEPFVYQGRNRPACVGIGT